MAVCAFFGHLDCPETIKSKLRDVLADLIINHDVDMFYVGHQGQFDAYVYSTLKALKQKYPQINYAIVLAYMPIKKQNMTFIPTPCCQKVSNPSTLVMPSPGATIGCFDNPTMSLHTLPTPRVAQHSLQARQRDKTKWL